MWMSTPLTSNPSMLNAVMSTASCESALVRRASTLRCRMVALRSGSSGSWRRLHEVVLQQEVRRIVHRQHAADLAAHQVPDGHTPPRRAGAVQQPRASAGDGGGVENVMATIGILVLWLCFTSVGRTLVSSDQSSVPSICSVAASNLRRTRPHHRVRLFGTRSTSPGASAPSALFMAAVFLTACTVLVSTP